MMAHESGMASSWPCESINGVSKCYGISRGMYLFNEEQLSCGGVSGNGLWRNLNIINQYQSKYQ